MRLRSAAISRAVKQVLIKGFFSLVEALSKFKDALYYTNIDIYYNIRNVYAFRVVLPLFPTCSELCKRKKGLFNTRLGIKHYPFFQYKSTQSNPVEQKVASREAVEYIPIRTQWQYEVVVRRMEQLKDADP